jgi:hypothetical protein
MKKNVYILLTLLGCTVGLFIHSCSKDAEQREQAKPTSTVTIPKDQTNTIMSCCSATCRYGSCSANFSPCSCSCGANGTPSCGGGLRIIDIMGDMLTVTANPEQLLSIGRAIDFLSQSANPSAQLVIQKLVIMQNLFQTNNNVINSTQALRQYETARRDFETILDENFTDDERAQLLAI